MALTDSETQAVREFYIVHSCSVDDALTRAARDVVILMRQLDEARRCASRGFGRYVVPAAAPPAPSDDTTSDDWINTGREQSHE